MHHFFENNRFCKISNQPSSISEAETENRVVVLRPSRTADGQGNSHYGTKASNVDVNDEEARPQEMRDKRAVESFEEVQVIRGCH